MFDTLTVVNRRNRPIEVQFDGKVIAFKPNEKRTLPEVVARNIIPQSALQLNLETGVTTLYGLGIDGYRAYPTDPLNFDDPVEILDRSDSPVLSETEPQVLTKDGASPMGIGKKDKSPTKLKSTGVVQPRGPQNLGEWGDSRVINKEG